MGMAHRIGYIKEGYDAGQQFTRSPIRPDLTNFVEDLVIWDSHPLALGATPTQVFIDGIPQLQRAFSVEKPLNYQRRPPVPNFDKDAQKAVVYEGLPPLEPTKSDDESTIVFVNVGTMYQQRNGVIEQIQIAQGEGSAVVTRSGSIICYNQCAHSYDADDAKTTIINIEGGSISPGFVSYGSPLGLEQITQEPSTNDGNLIDPLITKISNVIGGDYAIIRAADGLQFGTRDAL